MMVFKVFQLFFKKQEACTSEGFQAEHRIRLAPLLYAYLGTLFLAAILTPLIYSGVEHWFAHSPNELNRYLIKKPLTKYFSRIHLVSILIVIPWILSYYRLFSWEKLGINFGYLKEKSFWWHGVQGGSLVFLVIAFQAQGGGVHIKPSLSNANDYFYTWIVYFVTAGFTAFGVACIEELLFRGILLKLFLEKMKPGIALWMQAILFSYLHFKGSCHSVQEVTWFSGFIIACATLFGFIFHPDFISFINLLGLGILLGQLFLKKGHIMDAIGFHMGLVWVMLFYKKLFIVEKTIWGGSGNIRDGLMVTAILMAVFFWNRGLSYFLRLNRK